jgi:tectonic-1/3
MPDLQSPVHNPELGLCQNVVKEVRYMIYHNGTIGITKVCIYLWLTNITLHRKLSQKFSVTFHWTKDTKTFHRSGNPGYIVGRPVMSGKKVTRIFGTEGEIDREGIEIDENPEKWLSIAGAKEDGRCDLEGNMGNSLRHSVTFGENRRSSCMVFVSPSNFTSPSACTALHKTMIQLLSGTKMTNVTSAKEFNLYIATFGDAKVEDTGDWTQVILESVPSILVISSQNNDWTLVCKGIVTSIHIDIMFANVGSLANPQAKILGSVFRFGLPHDIIFTCSSLHCAHEADEQHFNVVSSVSFVDVTKPATVEFAEPPGYEVKLPHDFFYPFFSNSAHFRPNSTLILVLLFLFESVQSRIHCT